MHFSGQTILITGAARGVGPPLARALAAEGAHLVLWDGDAAGLEALRAELETPDRKVWSCVVDLADGAAIDTMARRCLAECGPVDVLVNHAGSVPGRPLLEVTDAEFEHAFAGDTLALFRTTRAFLPSMLKRHAGRVVTIASAAGLAGAARLTDSRVSRFAAVGFDEALRLELARAGSPVRTTVVCAWYRNTAMSAGVRPRFPWQLRIPTQDDVAGGIVAALRRGDARLVMPRSLYLSHAARLLPPRAFDALMAFFGVSEEEDERADRGGEGRRGAGARR